MCVCVCVCVCHFLLWTLPANSWVSNQLFSYDDIILSGVVSTQTNILHANKQARSICREIFRALFLLLLLFFPSCSSCVCLPFSMLCGIGTQGSSPADAWRSSAGFAWVHARKPVVFVMGNKPQARGREGNKPVSEMRVCATVAEQHNKGVVTPRGISSGQTHVLTLIHDGQQKPAPHNHTEWKKRSLTREPIQVTCLFYDFQEKKKPNKHPIRPVLVHWSNRFPKRKRQQSLQRVKIDPVCLGSWSPCN